MEYTRFWRPNNFGNRFHVPACPLTPALRSLAKRSRLGRLGPHLSPLWLCCDASRDQTGKRIAITALVVISVKVTARCNAAESVADNNRLGDAQRHQRPDEGAHGGRSVSPETVEATVKCAVTGAAKRVPKWK